MNEKTKHGLIVVGYFVFIVLLLAGTFFVLKPVRQNNLNKEILKKYSSVAEGVVRIEESPFESSIVTEKYIGYDENDKNIATLYTATANNQFGSITIVIAVSPEGDIIGINALDVNQSLSANETAGAINNFNGMINDNYDGVTGVTYSNDSVKEILEEIIKLQGDIAPPKPEEGITKLEDNKYLVAKTAKYHNDSEGMIAFNFEVSNEGVLLSYEEVYYEHTPGFKQNVLDFLDDLVANNSNISNPTAVLGDFDGKTGSTNTTTVVLDMLNDLNRFIFAQNAEEGVHHIEENEYLVIKTAEYFNGQEGTLAFFFTISEEGILLSYEEGKYGHTPGFKPNVLNFLDDLIANNSNISDPTAVLGDFDGKTGSTNSSNTIIEMLKDLAAFVEGEELEEVVKFIEETTEGRKYLVSKELVNVGANLALLEVEFVVATDNTLVSYEFVTYNHTGGNFKDITTAFLDSMIGADIFNPTAGLGQDGDLYDGQAGATNSTSAILDLLNELATFIGEDA